MAGGTSAFDMIKKLKENANLRNKKNYFKKKHNFAGTSKSILEDNVIETKEHHDEIMKMIKDERTKAIRKSIIILVLSILIVGTLILLLLIFVKP